MSSTVACDVYSSCVRKKFTSDNIKKFAAEVVLNESDQDEAEDIFRKKPKEKSKKTQRIKLTKKQQHCQETEKTTNKKVTRSQGSSAQADVILLDDDDDDDVTNSGELSFSKSLEPTPPPTPPADMVNTRRKRMKKDVRNAFAKLQKAQLAYRGDSDDDISIIEVTSPAKDPLNQKEISVKVKCHSGIEKFTMKMIDSFTDVFKELANHAHVSEDQLVMFLNDKKIHSYDTPASIGLEVADIIDCYIKKPGEISFDEDDSLLEDPDVINLGVQTSKSKSRLNIKIRMNDPLERLMREFCKGQNMRYENVIFQFDGENIQSYQTPSDLCLEDGDCIDVIEV